MALKRDVIDHDAEVSYSAMDWIIFLVSFAFQIGLLIFIPEWSWVGLPFWMTYLVKSLKQL